MSSFMILSYANPPFGFRCASVVEIESYIYIYYIYFFFCVCVCFELFATVQVEL